jgi:FKBP-type peptidyl-prolyl cis-trans isomerase FkpA
MMRAMSITTAALAAHLALAAGGCKSHAKPTPVESPRAAAMVQKVDRVTLGNGLMIEDLKVGEGDVCLPGAHVRVKYTGMVQGASRPFDTSGAAVREIDLGGNLIRGWTEGLPGMRAGGTRRLTIPPELGYGSREVKDMDGAVVVPAGSTLVYVVDLVGVGDR